MDLFSLYPLKTPLPLSLRALRPLIIPVHLSPLRVSFALCLSGVNSHHTVTLPHGSGSTHQASTLWQIFVLLLECLSHLHFLKHLPPFAFSSFLGFCAVIVNSFFYLPLLPELCHLKVIRNKTKTRDSCKVK